MLLALPRMPFAPSSSTARRTRRSPPSPSTGRAGVAARRPAADAVELLEAYRDRYRPVAAPRRPGIRVRCGRRARDRRGPHRRRIDRLLGHLLRPVLLRAGADGRGRARSQADAAPGVLEVLRRCRRPRLAELAKGRAAAVAIATRSSATSSATSRPGEEGRRRRASVVLLTPMASARTARSSSPRCATTTPRAGWRAAATGRSPCCCGTPPSTSSITPGRWRTRTSR